MWRPRTLSLSARDLLASQAVLQSRNNAAEIVLVRGYERRDEAKVMRQAVIGPKRWQTRDQKAGLSV